MSDLPSNSITTGTPIFGSERSRFPAAAGSRGMMYSQVQSPTLYGLPSYTSRDTANPVPGDLESSAMSSYRKRFDMKTDYSTQNLERNYEFDSPNTSKSLGMTSASQNIYRGGDIHSHLGYNSNKSNGEKSFDNKLLDSREISEHDEYNIIKSVNRLTTRDISSDDIPNRILIQTPRRAPLQGELPDYNGNTTSMRVPPPLSPSTSSRFTMARTETFGSTFSTRDLDSVSRQEKVKAIMSRVNQLTGKKKSSLESDSNYGQQQQHQFNEIVRTNDGDAPPSPAMSITNTSRISHHTSGTSTSSFHSEMNKFRQKWKIDQDDDEETIFSIKSSSIPSSTPQSRTREIFQRKAFDTSSRINKIYQSTNRDEKNQQQDTHQNSSSQQSTVDNAKDYLRRNATHATKVEDIFNREQIRDDRHTSMEFSVSSDDSPIIKVHQESDSKEKRFSMREIKRSHQDNGSSNNNNNIHIRMKDLEIEKLKSHIEKLEEDLHSSKNEIVVLSKEKNRSLEDHASASHAKKQNESLSMSLEHSKEKVDALENEKTVLRSKLQQSSSEIAELTQKNSSKDNEIESLKLQVESLEMSTASSSEVTQSELDMERMRFENRYERKEKEVSALRKELSESKKNSILLDEELSELREQLEEASAKASQISGLKAMLQESESFIKHLQKDKEMLEERQKSSISQIQKEFSEKAQISYQTENEQLKKIRTLEQEKLELSSEYHTLKRESEDKIKSLENTVKTLERTNASLRNKTVELNSALEKRSHTNINLEHDIEDLKCSISNVEHEKSQLQEKMNSLQASHTREKEKLSKQLENKLMENKGAMDSLEKALRRKDDFVINLQEEIRKLSSSTTSTRIMMSTSSISSNSNTTNSANRMGGNQNEEFMKYLEKELNQVTRDKSELEEKVRVLKQEKQQLQNQAESEMKSLQDKIHSLQNEVSEREQQINELSSNVEELNGCIDGKILLTRSELEEMETELKSAKTVLEREEDMQKMVVNYEDLQKSNTALKELVLVLREKLGEAENSFRDNYLELSQLRVEKDSNSDDLQLQVERLKRQLKDAEQRRESAELKLQQNSELLSKAEMIMSKSRQAAMAAMSMSVEKK